ncbi:MAG: lipocalin family protein [Bacteroidota bacterium]
MIAIPKTLLKNGLLSIGFVLMIILSSCGSDDGPVNDSNIIGVWQFSSILVDGEEAEVSDCTYQDTVEFKSDNTYIETVYVTPDPNVMTCITDDDLVSSGTWSIPSAGQLNVTFTFGEDSFTQTADYSISGKTLSITFNVGSIENITTYTRI